MSRQTILTLIMIAIILVAAACGTIWIQKQHRYTTSDAAQTLGIGELASYTTLEGQAVSLGDFDETVRVVNSWASWSPLSHTELIDLERLALEYRDRGVNVIAINRNEDPIRAQRFIEQLATFEHIRFLMDGSDAFYARMDGKAMPETLFFDKSGNTVMHARGDLTYEEMVTYVEAALAAE